MSKPGLGLAILIQYLVPSTIAQDLGDQKDLDHKYRHICPLYGMLELQVKAMLLPLDHVLRTGEKRYPSHGQDQVLTESSR